jgi:hypothetical protein
MRGDQGIALIHRIVNGMGFVWNAIHLEAGIDGIIEVRDVLTGEVSNCIIQVQSKAGSSYFKAETDATFEFVCDARDLDYWLRGNAPVILVVSRPDNDEAYWTSIKDYFRDTQVRKARKIVFHKNIDRFDADCRHRLATLAIPSDSGLYLPALPCTEALTSNLLPVLDYPKRLFRASTKLRFPRQVWNRLRKYSQDPAPEWCLHDGFIYAFHDLIFTPWTKVCLASTTENLATDDWAYSNDRARQYVFVRMLRSCVNELLYRQRVRFQEDKEHYFFRSTPDFAERKVGGLSVFKGYESKTTPDRIAYYRHRAMKLRFLRFERQWYAEITPTYRFTQDGFRLSRFFEQRLKGIKQLERQNKTHLRQVQLWEAVLRQTQLSSGTQRPQQQSLFGDDECSVTEDPITPYSLLTFGQLISFEVDWGIPESTWLPPGAGETDDETDSAQRRLFDL